jgi:UDP-glucose:(heptosyl)LPS alpha-1,3-glucosyltransferase
MKFTIACKQFGRAGGAETFLVNFAGCLAAEGHRVTVLAAQGEAEIEGVETRRLSLPRVPKAFRDLALARASLKALRGVDADVTFSDAKCWGADVVRPGGGVQRAYVKERPKSYHNPVMRALNNVYRSLNTRERLRIAVDDALYAPPGPRIIIANSGMVRRDLLRYYPHLADRIRVVHNGADPARFSPALRKYRGPVRRELGISDDALVGVFVGHDWRRKGLHTFVEALGILAHKGTRRPICGIVVGRGNRRRVARFARRCGAQALLKFADSTEPDRYYGAADLLVLPSFFDPCANVTIEGLACGLPAITSVYNGAFEMLEPGLSGFYVSDASDSAQLAGFIEYYLDRERLAAGRDAARSVAARYTLQDQHRKMMDCLQEVAQGGR